MQTLLAMRKEISCAKVIQGNSVILASKIGGPGLPWIRGGGLQYFEENQANLGQHPDV